jgi:hypothetical protein
MKSPGVCRVNSERDRTPWRLGWPRWQATCSCKGAEWSVDRGSDDGGRCGDSSGSPVAGAVPTTALGPRSVRHPVSRGSDPNDRSRAVTDAHADAGADADSNASTDTEADAAPHPRAHTGSRTHAEADTPPFTHASAHADAASRAPKRRDHHQRHQRGNVVLPEQCDAEGGRHRGVEERRLPSSCHRPGRRRLRDSHDRSRCDEQGREDRQLRDPGVPLFDPPLDDGGPDGEPLAALVSVLVRNYVLRRGRGLLQSPHHGSTNLRERPRDSVCRSRWRRPGGGGRQP